MKALKSTVLLGIAFVLLTGCATFDAYKSKAAGEIASGIASYCAETTQTVRDEIRAEVNEAAAPNSIIITCG